MQVVLSMFRSDGDRRSFSLHKDTTIVGRKEDCDLRIPLGEISRKHCRIIKNDEGLKIEDLGSSNGTYRNGERVQEALVMAGDTIQVGSIAFVVQIDGTPADEEMQPVLAQKVATAEDSSATVADPEGSDVAPAAEASEDSDVQPATADAEESGAGVAAENNGGNPDDDFDPMAFLQGGDSQASGGAIAMDLDQSGVGELKDED